MTTKELNTTAYIHLYTGDGKGKTTAAIGLAIRAAGAGKNVFIAQFVKGMHYSEIDNIKLIPNIRIKQYGRQCFIKNKPTQADVEAAKKGFDEINIALLYQLITVDDLLALLKNKPADMEIVLTGRAAPHALYDIADLVTEMKEIKHYYHCGVKARKGIEF